jgi:GNAT superfamily N-acetyltransferase
VIEVADGTIASHRTCATYEKRARWRGSSRRVTTGAEVVPGLPMTGPPEVEIIEARAARLDDIESLWESMHEYHAGVGEARTVVPFRRAEDSWQRRRDEFERWMRAGDAWLLIAEREGSPVGFAFFRICDSDWSFETNERMGELEALSVEPELRRWGIGSLLMEEVERRLAAAGVAFIGLAVIAGNEDALRFYRRWGMVPSHVRCLGPTLRDADE